MPDTLESIVQKMIDAGESEENIASVIKEYKQPRTNIKDYKGPTSFLGGAFKSLTSGEAFGEGGAADKSVRGFAKGALLDLPASLVGSLESIANFLVDPVSTTKSAIQGIPGALSSIAETTTRAGSDPEAFGRMMGNITGQPLATAGLARGAPAGFRAAGTPIEATGRVMRRYQPFSGFIPRIAESRTLRNIERGMGSKIEQVGQWMKRPTKQGVVVEGPMIREGEIIPDEALMRRAPDPKIPEQLGPGRRTFYGNPPNEPIVPQTGPKLLGPGALESPKPVSPKFGQIKGTGKGMTAEEFARILREGK